MHDDEQSGADQPWGTEAHGSVPADAGTQSGTGVGGASLAGTPAAPSGDGDENAEAETSGLKPPEGTANQPSGQTGPTAEPPRGPGAFTDDAAVPPVFDE